MTKRIVLAFGLTETKVDPKFCDHKNALLIQECGESWLQCPDCHATIELDGEIVRVAPDEIPIWEGDL